MYSIVGMALATVSIFLSVILISTFNVTDAFSMKMIPIDSPHLQVLPQNITFQERHQFLAKLSLSRAHSARNGGSNSNFSVKTLKSFSHRLIGNYYVTQLFFGQADRLDNRYVLLDTGDDKTWIQCDGCDPCFELKSGNLDVQDLPNYARLSTDDTRCNPKFEFDGSCGYRSQYGPSSSEGYMGTTSFIFANSQNQLEEYQKIAFGCGIKNENMNFGRNTGPENLIAGIHGISPSPRSFLNQLAGVTKGRFTYCLTAYTEPNAGRSTIHFGDDAQISGDDTRKVQQIKLYVTPRYAAYVSGISVDENRLPIDPSIFEAVFDQTGFKKGFIFDTGAPHTVLAMSAYQPLRDAVAKYFQDHYGWQPLEEALYDLCYQQSLTQGLHIPSVVFHFYTDDKKTGEVDMVLPGVNVFLPLNEGFCMTIQPIPDPGPCVFGAYQMANFKFLYDVVNLYVYFVPQRCQENL